MKKPPFTLVFLQKPDDEGRRTSQIICDRTPEEITAIFKASMKDADPVWLVNLMELLVMKWAVGVYFEENCCCPGCFAEEVREQGWDPVEAMHAIYKLARKGWIEMLEVPRDDLTN